jgi:HEAT repeat protein/S1-C subfamily serine protease
MIRYACPKCDTNLKSADETAGSKTACPRCGERFDVPAAEQKSAERKERNGDSKTGPIRKPAAAGKKTSAKGRKDRDEGGSKTPVLVFVGIGVAAFAVVAVVGVLLLTKKPATQQVASNSAPATTPVVPVVSSTAQTGQTTQTDTKANPPGDAEKKPPAEGGQPPNQKPVIATPTTPAAEGAPPEGGRGHEIYEKLLKSTVFVVIDMGSHGNALASGSLIDRKNKLILTNYHVVMDNPEARIYVFFPEYENGQLMRRKDYYTRKLQLGQGGIPCTALTGVEHSQRDLALMHLEGEIPPEVQPIKLARESVKPGDTVRSMGNAGASDACWVYSEGQVRQVYHPPVHMVGGGGGFFFIDAQIVETQSPTNPGDSGGPMVNDRGELVAVTHAGLNPLAANLMTHFIDVSEVKFLCNYYYKKNDLTKGYEEATSLGPSRDLSGSIKALDGPDTQGRREAAEQLGSAGEAAKKAVPKLVKHLKDMDEGTRKSCAQALELIGGLSASELPTVVQALKDGDMEVRKACAGALARMGAEAEDAAKPLSDLLADSEPAVRKAAAAALAKIGSSAKVAVPSLVKALKEDQSSEVRIEAARALGKMGSEAIPVVRDLADVMTHDTRNDVCSAVLIALTGLQGDAKEALGAIIKMLDAKNTLVRYHAIQACASMKDDARAAAPKLAEILKYQELREPARQALVAIGKPAIKYLIDSLKSPRWEVREAACRALGELGLDAKSALPYLLQVVQRDPDPRAKRAAAQAVEKVQGK